jgi:hypothetical protein
VTKRIPVSIAHKKILYIRERWNGKFHVATPTFKCFFHPFFLSTLFFYLPDWRIFGNEHKYYYSLYHKSDNMSSHPGNVHTLMAIFGKNMIKMRQLVSMCTKIPKNKLEERWRWVKPIGLH